MTAPPHPDERLCAFCGIDVPTMEAIAYHGVVYHPACVAPTTGRMPDQSARERRARDRRRSP